MEFFYLINICLLSLILLIKEYKFMLLVLMMIEMMIISISVLMYLSFSIISLEIWMIYYLIFSVCESVMGLIILVMMIRFYGFESYKLINLMKFN